MPSKPKWKAGDEAHLFHLFHLTLWYPYVSVSGILFKAQFNKEWHSLHFIHMYVL